MDSNGTGTGAGPGARDGTRDVVLRELRLRGMIPATPGPEEAALRANGFAVLRGERLVITPSGREAYDRLARLAEGTERYATVRRAYDRFLVLNAELLQLCHDWQVRPGGVPNDHTDPHYDWGVVDRIRDLDERAGALTRSLGRAVEHLAGYRERLRHALRRLDDGDAEWLTSPRCDSYHTVWMQLHEELLLTLGLPRSHEGTDNPPRDNRGVGAGPATEETR